MSHSFNEFEVAYQNLREKILNLEIQPGTMITETAMATFLGIGRTPVREALKRLEHDGLIVTKNRRKTVYILSQKEVAEIFDLKICLEGQIAAWASERGTDEEKAKLENIWLELQAIGKAQSKSNNDRRDFLQKWLQKDKELHSQIFLMARNDRAANIIEKLNLQWHQLRVGIYTIGGRIHQAIIEHELFVNHILNNQPQEAQKTMKSHLNALKEELLSLMKVFQYPNN